jgi:spore maturation protein B
MTELLIPLVLAATACWALRQRLDVYGLLVDGAAEGLRTLRSIVPPLVVLLTAVHLLRASGAIDVLSQLLGPLFARLGIPVETAPLLLIRPISGSAALAVGADLMATYGVDSTIGRTAAVMLGSTETTFYTISVYCGAAGIRRTRYTIPAALLADLTGFVAAAATVRLFG